MKKVGLLYDDIFLRHEMPAGHPESGERLNAIISGLTGSPVWKKLVHCKPRRAERKDILSVHTSRYYEKTLTYTGYLDPDTYVSSNSVEAAHYAVGAALEAIDQCKAGTLDRAFCAVRPPGHHAEADRAMGFCIFNNVAIGAKYARGLGYQNIFIIDFDVHHGNGTQHTFEEDDSVYYFSTHQYPHYPGTGAESEKGRSKGIGFTYNIPMQYGAGDEEYLHAYNEILPGLVAKFGPDLVLVSAGYDIHIKDPLSGIRVTSNGIRQIVKSIIGSCAAVPFVFCLEGGYNLSALGESVVITIEELLKN